MDDSKKDLRSSERVASPIPSRAEAMTAPRAREQTCPPAPPDDRRSRASPTHGTDFSALPGRWPL